MSSWWSVDERGLFTISHICDESDVHEYRFKLHEPVNFSLDGRGTTAGLFTVNWASIGSTAPWRPSPAGSATTNVQAKNTTSINIEVLGGDYFDRVSKIMRKNVLSGGLQNWVSKLYLGKRCQSAPPIVRTSSSICS